MTTDNRTWIGVLIAGFDALIPQLGVPTAAGQSSGTADGTPPPGLAALAGGRVLVVEDNALNQEVATELLNELGLTVDLAADGALALEKVRQDTYDLVLMDMQMPVMDGIEATRAIRRLSGCTDLPIVAMTANAMAGDRERCLAAGMNDHLAKPIDPEDLWQTLLRWVRPRTGTPTTTVVTASADPPASAPEAFLRLAEVAGLDTATGLRQAMDREGLYLSLLADFVASQAESPVRLTAALAADDWTGAEREAHTLKGTAALIGAGELRTRAEQLERAIRSRTPQVRLSVLRTELAEVLGPLVRALAERLPQAPPAPADPTAADPAEVRRLCTRLARLLQDDDLACAQLLKEHEGLLRRTLGERYPRLAEALAGYDFGAALEVLRGTGWLGKTPICGPD